MSVFRPVASKRETEKNVLEVTCHATRELPSGAIEAAQWFATRPVAVRVCMYPVADDVDPGFIILARIEPSSTIFAFMYVTTALVILSHICSIHLYDVY